MRYNNTGRHTQTIPHRETPHQLYRNPIYITENNNGDVVVSDWLGRAVVLTSREGVHRFSYTGPPSGTGLGPSGICTDALSNILVCDRYNNTVQMLSEDGRFLKYLLTNKSAGVYRPSGLSYDVHTHHLWVVSGSLRHNTGSVNSHINRDLTPTGMSDSTSFVFFNKSNHFILQLYKLVLIG